MEIKMTNKEVYSMKNKSNFIVTTDKGIADKLILEGFRLITDVNGKFTFENKPPESFTFTEVDSSKVAYTNILTF